MVNIYECKICKQFSKRKLKGEKRFRGTRKNVRKHLVEVHNKKGRKNIYGSSKKDFGQSDITESMESTKW